MLYDLNVSAEISGDYILVICTVFLVTILTQNCDMLLTSILKNFDCLFQFDWPSIRLDQLLTFCFFHLSSTLFHTFNFFCPSLISTTRFILLNSQPLLYTHTLAPFLFVLPPSPTHTRFFLAICFFYNRFRTLVEATGTFLVLEVSDDLKQLWEGSKHLYRALKLGRKFSVAFRSLRNFQSGPRRTWQFKRHFKTSVGSCKTLVEASGTF